MKLKSLEILRPKWSIEMYSTFKLAYVDIVDKSFTALYIFLRKNAVAV